MNEVNIKVSVIIITYNQINYLYDAINGVLNQTCDFDFEIIISDDFSPINPQSIVDEFVSHKNFNKIKFFRHEENKGPTENFLWSLNQCQGVYIAQCEGDDYWIDPLKLQKQVDFLDKNPSYGLVGTASEVLNQNYKVVEKLSDYNVCIDLNYLTSNWFSNTCTLLFRRSMFEIPSWITKYKNGDYILILAIALKSKIFYFSDVTSVYRKQGQGISNKFTEKNVIENIVGIINSFITDPIFNVNESQKRQLLEGQYNFIKKSIKGVIIDELNLKELHFIIKDKIHESIKLYEFEDDKVLKIKNETIKHLSLRQLFSLFLGKIFKK